MEKRLKRSQTFITQKLVAFANDEKKIVIEFLSEKDKKKVSLPSASATVEIKIQFNSTGAAVENLIEFIFYIE